MTDLAQLFDADWYLARYTDVAQAGLNPLQHYLTHGRYEGRQPCALEALELETLLWQADDTAPYLAQLQKIISDNKPAHAGLAAWVLGRWYGSFANWQQVTLLAPLWLNDELALDIIGHQGPFLLAFSASYNLADRVGATSLLDNCRWPDTVDKTLAATMLLNGEARIAALSQLFQSKGLAGLSWRGDGPLLDSLMADAGTSWPQRLWQRCCQPLVTVIVPCFNAAATLKTALNSLLKQSWQKLEILVVDDKSTDNSVAIVQAVAARDRRVRLLRLAENSGAYAARNLGLSQARGAFITTHDADDWSHPEKIARQVQALQQETAAMACVSHWVRCDADLQFQRWRTEDAWVYRNVSSLMFRAAVHASLGFWDLVSVNADTEYYYRIKQAFGAHSIIEVLPGLPLAFGRADERSLSQTSATHLRTQFNGVRKDYMDAALHWQQTATPEELYLPAEPECRPFAVPPLICRGQPNLRLHNNKLLITAANGFDPRWYQARYADVAAAGVDPLEHYLLHGEQEGRDPTPLFSSSGYAYQAGLTSGASALLAAISSHTDLTTPVIVTGSRQAGTQPHILLVAHAAERGEFGAERSFLDVLQSLQDSGFRLTVALPGARNTSYVDTVRQYCHSVLILPYAWWAGRRPCQQLQLEYLTDFIKTRQVKLVYANTLVLDEPLLAARAAGVPGVVHVRELPSHDVSLCQALNATAEQIRQHVLNVADYLIANSTVVANWLAAPERCTVIANALQVRPVADIVAEKRLKVGMLSSNLAKKGLADFMTLAQNCARQQLPLDFLLFGPDSPDLQHYVEKQQLPANLQICGYVSSPELALAQLHVVVNLSHFQESFGRTVLEAMQAGRVVVAYRWGALPELIREDCGFLVPFKDIAAVEQILCRLQQDQTMLLNIARHAKRYASEQFSIRKLGQELTALFNQRLNNASAIEFSDDRQISP